MELPHIGQQCFHTDCKQLDFLPLQCKCGKQFCSEHFTLHIESCEFYKRPEVTQQKFKNSFKCSHENCNETSLLPLICETCLKHFCIKHRHFQECYGKDEKSVAKEKERYAAPIRQFNEAKANIDNQIANNLRESNKKGKNKNIINKVQLMKIKSKAKGPKNVPLEERIYFNIIHSAADSEQIVPVFISKNWSVGRAIDAIACECKLQNNNNKSTAKKLKLFKKETGEIITKDFAEGVQFLINNNVIMEGENLIIQYVNDGQYVLNQL